MHVNKLKNVKNEFKHNLNAFKIRCNKKVKAKKMDPVKDPLR